MSRSRSGLHAVQSQIPEEGRWARSISRPSRARDILGVEHPFGTLKFWMGATHFLCRTLPRVRTEMSLHVLAYNLKRVMRIFGIGEMLRVLTT